MTTRDYCIPFPLECWTRRDRVPFPTGHCIEFWNEGIFVGISAGGTLTAALKVAEEAEPGSVILVMLPDTGERYLSTFMFDDIPEESDDDWLAQQG